MKSARFLATFALAILVTLPLAAEPLTVLSNGTALRFIDTAAPGTSLSTVTLTGLLPSETVAAIDYRPANNLLYGIGVTTGTGSARLLTINTTTGAVTQVGAGPFHATLGLSQLGMDFNPVVDRIRIISNTGINLRVNPNDASVLTDTTPAFAPGDVNAANGNKPLGLAYTNNAPGASTTTLYGIVSGVGPLLVTVGSVGGAPTSPNSGQMFTVGQTGLGGYFAAQQAFDISRTGAAYAVVDNNNVLYTINLTTGQATALGALPAGTVITGLSAPTALPAGVVPTLDPLVVAGLALLAAAIGVMAMKH